MIAFVSYKKSILLYLRKIALISNTGNTHTGQCLNKNCCVAINADGCHKVNRLKCFFENIFMHIPEIG